MLSSHCTSYRVPLKYFPHRVEEYLERIHLKPVYGDVIVSTSGKRTIFNGRECISLDYNVDRSGALHPQFKVIESGFAVNYWMENLSKGIRGIRSSDVVWFDHKKVLDQCLNNITTDKNSGHCDTSFYYGNYQEPFFILFNAGDKEDAMELLHRDRIIFEHVGMERTLMVSYLNK